ncbi:MAG: hypothetical protein WC372_12845 [Candidatus Neomarinimicrobiota bacterium]|jgi:hypothetical protein
MTEEKEKDIERSKRACALWADPAFRENMIMLRNSKGYKKRRSKIAKKTWKDSNVRKRRIKTITVAMNDEETRKNHSKYMKKRHKEDEEYHKKAISFLKKTTKYEIVRKKRIRNFGGVIEDSSLRNE